EARAAVRARLMEWVATIQDRDISNLYRQAFRERLDEAFFTQRNQSFNRPQNRKQPFAGQRDPRTRFTPERPPSPHLKQVGAAIDASLADAILCGLLRYPDRIGPHVDLLNQVQLADSNSAALLNT